MTTNDPPAELPPGAVIRECHADKGLSGYRQRRDALHAADAEPKRQGSMLDRIGVPQGPHPTTEEK